MAVSFDAVGPGASGQSAVNTTPLTWSHTCGASATLLTVQVAINAADSNDSGTTLSVTYNGVSMTSAGKVHINNTAAGFTEMFYLVNPAVGSHTVSVAIAGTTTFTSVDAGSLSFIGASGVQNFVSAFGNSTAPSVAVTSAVGDIVVDSVATGTRVVSSQTTNRWKYSFGNSILYVQSKGATATSGTSITGTFTSAQTAGNLNIVAVMWGSTTATVSSVTDSNGNSYSLAVGPTVTTGLNSYIYYAKNIVGGASNTVTVVFSTNVAFPNLNLLEYSGIDTTNPLDVTAAAVGNGTLGDSGPATTTTANELIFGSGSAAGNFTGAGTGFINRIINAYGAIAEDKIVSTTGSYDATAVVTSGAWTMQMATFKGGKGGGGASTAAGATTVTMGYTVAADNWAIAAMDITASVAGNMAATSSGTGTASATLVSSFNGVHSVDLAWNPNPVGDNVIFYNIKRAPSVVSGSSLIAGTYAQLDTSTTNSYTDTISLVEGQTYWYEVSAVNSAGESSLSLSASALIPFTRTLPSAGRGNASASLANTTGAIAAVSNGAALGTLLMSGSASISGLSTASAVGSMALSGVQTGIAGSSNGQATGTVSLTGSTTISATSNGQAGAAVVLSATGVLAGLSAGSALGTATETGATLISGEADGAATATLSLTGAGAIVAASAGQAQAIAFFSGGAQANGKATGLATLTGSGSIADGILSIAASHGAAVGSVILIGSTVVTGTSTGRATANLAISGASSASATAAGIAVGSATLIGLLAAFGETDGLATALAGLAGTGTIAATSAGVAQAVTTFSGTAQSDGLATGSATLTASGSIASVANGSAFGSVTFGGSTTISGTSNGAAFAIAKIVSAILGTTGGLASASLTLTGDGLVSGSSNGNARLFGQLASSLTPNSVTPAFVEGSFFNTVYDFAPHQTNTLDIVASGPWQLVANVPWITFSQLTGTTNASVTILPYKLESFLPMATNGVLRVREGSYSFIVTLIDSAGFSHDVPLTMVIGYGDTVGTGPLLNQ